MLEDGSWYEIYAEEKDGGHFIMAAFLTGKPEERTLWFDREWQFYDYILLSEVNDV